MSLKTFTAIFIDRTLGGHTESHYNVKHGGHLGIIYRRINWYSTILAVTGLMNLAERISLHYILMKYIKIHTLRFTNLFFYKTHY